MKFVLLFVAVFGLSSATVHRDFIHDVDEFIRLLPMDDYFSILNEHLADPQVQTVFRYLQGDDFAGLTERISEKQAWNEIKNWIIEKEVDIDFMLAIVREIINVIEFPTTVQDMGGFRAFADAMQDVTPYDEIFNFIDEKIHEGGDFAELIEDLSRDETRQLFEEITEDPVAVYMFEKLTAFGIDVQSIMDAIYSFFSWNTFVEV